MSHIDLKVDRLGDDVVCAKCRHIVGSAKVSADPEQAFRHGLELGAELAGHCCAGRR